MIKLLVLIICVLTLNESAFANSCICPDRDPVSQPSCGPVPARLKTGDTAPVLNSKSCPTCFDYHHPFEFSFLGTPENRIDPAELKKKMAEATCKSPTELSTYLNCNRENTETDQKNFCHFKNTLSPIIALAAKSANLPYAVEACLFKRESEFNPKAHSRANANGYIQFTHTTVRDMNHFIQRSAEKLRADLDENRAKVAKLQGSKNVKAYRSAVGLQQGLYAHYRARLAWDEYWKGTPNPPTHIDDETVHCQNTAFAASAVKQMMDLWLMIPGDTSLFKDDEIPSVGEMDLRQSAVYIAGAYNKGISVQKICAHYPTLKGCIERMKHVKNETYLHMRGIDACSQKENWKSLDHNEEQNCEETSACLI